MIPAGQEFILAQERGKQRLLQAEKELSEAFALAVPHDEALRIRDAVAFFQAVRAALLKHIPDNHKSPEVLDHAIRQIDSKALVSDEIVDIDNQEKATQTLLEQAALFSEAWAAAA
jgi:type I restriction enzyme R subunit